MFFLASTTSVFGQAPSKPSLDVFGPRDNISGMFNPEKDTLTCPMLLSNTIVYPSGQTQLICQNTYNLCMIIKALENKIKSANTPTFRLPKGMTIERLKKDLAFGKEFTDFYLRGCQLVIGASQTGFNGTLPPPPTISNFTP
ncbi:hypothetical protein [Candidatus Bealeia paramacronuclearis]|uniref:hypothetical protein n=1 Tax=Candidatus Bealeia paramacronuclearis TaxID=1921001 RepID=UPI002F2654D7